LWQIGPQLEISIPSSQCLSPPKVQVSETEHEVWVRVTARRLVPPRECLAPTVHIEKAIVLHSGLDGRPLLGCAPQDSSTPHPTCAPGRTSADPQDAG
jgi:hypothetical protein